MLLGVGVTGVGRRERRGRRVHGAGRLILVFGGFRRGMRRGVEGGGKGGRVGWVCSKLECRRGDIEHGGEHA